MHTIANRRRRENGSSSVQSALEIRRYVGLALTLLLAQIFLVGGAAAFPENVTPKTSASSDFTDLWWNPSESGWGMQMVNTGTYIFATIYVYGPSGAPTWYVSGAEQTATAGTFTGPLFAVTGPYFGVPFDPSAVSERQVGMFTFAAATPNTGQLTYSVDGLTVTKSIQRQPLTLDNYNGIYAAVMTQTTTGCANAANNGSQVNAIAAQITQNGTSMSLALGTACTATGTYSQLGRNGTFQGGYTCTTGEVGNAFVAEMNNHVRQFNGRIALQSTNNGCITVGRITGLIPD